jgi:hypothetical protein
MCSHIAVHWRIGEDLEQEGDKGDEPAALQP